MYPRVFVTGVGIISSIGSGTAETLDALRNARTGIGRLTHFASARDNIPVAEVKFNNQALAGMAGLAGNAASESRNTMLSLIAAGQAVKSSAWERKPHLPTGAVFATTVGGMDLNEQYYKSLLESDEHKDMISLFDSADCTEKIAHRFGIHQLISTVSTACSSSANAILLGSRLIRNRLVKRVLAGGSDALTKFTINGFNGLEILSPTGCRPFDLYRNGLTIGEGAAALVLESEDSADPSSIICEVKGYANVNEAYHATSSAADGSGAIMAMAGALRAAGLTPADISYINAHGTGTQVNDLSEGIAISKVFGENLPPVSSTKSFTGHTLGAAGAIEAVIAALAIQHQVIIPQVNFGQPMAEFAIHPQLTMTPARVDHVMSNSFGFGGSNTTLIFSKV
ncbi:MAG: beta-ketoacyl-[acyl-carrier-protein] synthase family protein [Bacteroidales bacterium]|nr:beta-ketoacyl-[acyl-carrier-protein] synthase family protein [Bacteroidales bacterium]